MKKSSKKEPPRYIANTETRVIHDLDYEDERCNLDEIEEEHIKPYSVLVDALIEGYKQCQWCFDKYHHPAQRRLSDGLLFVSLPSSWLNISFRFAWSSQHGP